MFRTAYSYVLEPRPGRRSVTWFGYDAAHGTVWLPFYGAAEQGAPATHCHHGLNMSTFNTKLVQRNEGDRVVHVTHWMVAVFIPVMCILYMCAAKSAHSWVLNVSDS